MNKFSISAAAALIVTTSMTHAGGMADPVMVMEPAMVMEESASSSSNLLIPLIIIALIAAAASGTSGGGGDNGSDARAKTDITQVGIAANGLPIYQYRYIGSSTVFEGVMAQDVLEHTPEAVVTYPSGLMAVKYGMLGMRLRVVD